jgi:hypothetical protein
MKWGVTVMRKLSIDEATYAAWARRAAECGMSVEDWLRAATGQGSGNGDSPDARSAKERLRMLDEFESTLVGLGGDTVFDREQLYE